MIDTKFLNQLKKNHRDNESRRRQINSLSNTILIIAKKTIFALHRHDILKAEQNLQEIEKNLIDLQKKFGPDRLQAENSYRAAVEEYLESKTFYNFIQGKKIKSVSRISLNHESYLAGICDLMGELVRYAANQAAEGKFSQVPITKKITDDIMAQLLDFDMTGYLRTKYDQARGHWRRLEQMNYEINIRNKK